MPSTTTTENHSITYPAEGAEGWYATWETLIQDITDNFDDIVNFRAAILKDTNGNELMAFTATGSAVNHLGLANAATGNAPVLETLGDDTNVDGIIQGKGTGSIIVENLVVGQVTNLGITYSSSTLSVSGAKTALSSTNPAFLCLPSKTAGLNVTVKVTADQGFLDDTGASEIIGNLFGMTTSVAVTVDVPFYIYAVLNDAETGVAFMCSRIPHRALSPAVAEIGAPDDAVADAQYSFFSFDNIDETLYDGNPCICIGAFRMQMSASDDWTVQALSTEDGIGRFHEHTLFSMPEGQFGADASTITIANGGTAATFGDNTGNYYIHRSGNVEYGYSMRNDGGTDGSGSVDALVAIPFYADGSIVGIGGHIGVSNVRNSTSNTYKAEITGVRGSGAQGLFIFKGGSLAFWQWSEFGNGNREIWGTQYYKIKDEA